ncbi:RluA family pseudouridine synthase [Brevibacillus dissolubilis]|uniref:RluA family pseudouridine synthase n=1 Tax=Brevibacillus dissolubilis TaxID=1844116 RepID=UPI0011178645|nr:RluA family pseudouridine synthase [Brevibacillus dissolubilis]
MNDTAVFERFDWTVETEDKGERIDKFITLQNEEWTRSQVQAWVKEDRVTVNGEPVKNNYKVHQDDEITLRVPPPRELEIKPEPMDLEIVYEDADVVVVNKPRGLVVHPAPGHYSGTLVNGLMHHCKDLSGINGVLRPGIVHRIDKDTSGLLMIAKNDKAHLGLSEQLKNHTVNRKYVALVHGVIQHEMGTIDAPIGRNPKNRQEMAVVFENSKNAVTHFLVMERFKDYSLVELKLETGRTHQIRVHMKYIGYPLVGDPKYGKKDPLIDLDGQALHAKTLGFVHPRTGEYLEFEAPLPPELVELTDFLRKL